MVTTTFRQSSEITKVLRHVLEYVPSTILPTVFATFAVFIYTREFTASQYGVYNFILSIVTPMTLLATEWAAQPIARYYAQYQQQESLDVYRRGVVTLMTLVIGGVFVFSLLLACALMIRFSFSLLMLSGIVASVLTQCAFVLTSRILPSSLRADRYRRITVWVSVISVGTSLFLMQILGRNIAWLFWGQAIANVVLLPFLMRWNQLSFRLNEMLRLTPEFKSLFRQFFAYGAPMLIWFLSNNLLDDEDRWILQWFHGSAQVGIYSVNYNLISSIGNFMNIPVITAVGPILYHQWSLRQFDEARKTISGMTEIYFILAAMVLGGTMVVGTPVVHLFLGVSFWKGASILIPVLIGRILWGAASIGHRTLELSERTLTMGVSGIIAAALNLLLNLVFVPRFGYQAAAISTAVSYCAYAVIIRWQSRQYIIWTINIRYILSYVVVAIGCAVIIRICLFQWLWLSSPAAQVAVGLSAYMVLFAVLLLFSMKKRLTALISFRF